MNRLCYVASLGFTHLHVLILILFGTLFGFVLLFLNIE